MSKLTRAERRKLARQYAELRERNEAEGDFAEAALAEPEMQADPVLRAALPVLRESGAVRRESDAQRDSAQPRLSSPNTTFASVYRWVQMAGMEEPAYLADSRVRDKWLRAFGQREPLLAGVINSVVTIDKNRGWNLTGGRRQVNTFMRVLHDNYVAYPDSYGWRPGIAAAARSYYTSDLGAVREIGRISEGGPLWALYHVDSARCRLTGDPDTPLEYHPASGGVQPWSSDDYYRVVSGQSTDETLNGLGYCAVSRCIELAKIMLAVWMHDQEQLAARAPRGLLLLQNIGEQQWDDAMQARDEKLDNAEFKYYGALAVLAGMGPDEVDAKLVALSNLPKDWNTERFVNMLMYGYALAFGYDPREFWPVSGGQLGTATETETQHRKATGKGGLDFALADQEQLQRLLPPTLLFEYEQRDTTGELADVTVRQAQASLVASMYNAGLPQGAPVIEREEARQLLAEMGLIPEEWTEADEQVSASDKEVQAEEVEDVEESPEESIEDNPDADETNEEPEETPARERRRTRAIAQLARLDRDEIRRAISTFPEDDIVTAHWPSMQVRTIRRAAWRATRQPRLWTGARRGIALTVEHEAALKAAQEGAHVGD